MSVPSFSRALGRSLLTTLVIGGVSLVVIPGVRSCGSGLLSDLNGVLGDYVGEKDKKVDNSENMMDKDVMDGCIIYKDSDGNRYELNLEENSLLVNGQRARQIHQVYDAQRTGGPVSIAYVPLFGDSVVETSDLELVVENSE